VARTMEYSLSARFGILRACILLRGRFLIPVYIALPFFVNGMRHAPYLAYLFRTRRIVHVTTGRLLNGLIVM